MDEIKNLSPTFARRMLERMGSTGQPPERGAHLVNVGTGEYLDVLLHEYLRPIKERIASSTFKLIQAPFGGGKTQFLRSLREIAWTEGFATVPVGLSPKECPFDRSDAIYREVARSIEYPPDSLEGEPEVGLERFLERVAEERIGESGRQAFAEWVAEELRRADMESRSFRRATHLWFTAYLADDLDEQEVLVDYLMGESVAKEELRSRRLTEELTDKVAFRWLRSLAQLVHVLGLPGTVMLFDEMDRNMSLPVKRRRAVGDNLRETIDQCGQERVLPGVVWCYAVPPEFMDTVVPEYPALAQRLRGVMSFSSVVHQQPIIDLDRLPLDPATLYRAIGMKLLELAERAYEWTADRTLQSANLRALADRFDAASLEAGARRRFVKAAAAMIATQRLEEERELSEDELNALVGSTSTAAMGDFDGEETF